MSARVTVTRAERIARMKRDLAELRSRMQRIEGEAFAATRQISEIEGELADLATEGHEAAVQP